MQGVAAKNDASYDLSRAWALGKIWIVAQGLPPNVVERIGIASGSHSASSVDVGPNLALAA
jgi:hypothetical protein